MSQRGPMVEIHDASPDESGPHALFGFVGVPADARAVHAPEIRQLALEQLRALFGEAMASPLDLRLKDWAYVPGIAVSADRIPMMSHPHYGLPRHLKNLWDNTLHLASTEAGQQFGGFLEGALEAAETTARDVAKRLQQVA